MNPEIKKQKDGSILSGLVGFFLGIIVCLTWQACWSLAPHIGFRWSHSQNRNPGMPDPFVEIFKDDSGDPFLQFEKLRRKMMQPQFHQFPPANQDPDIGLDSDSESGLTPGAGQVEQREDADFIYLDISIRGLDRQSLSVEVNDGQVSLRGQLRVQSKNGGELIESFNRSFPAPSDTDSKKVEIENSSERLTLKFPKFK